MGDLPSVGGAATELAEEELRVSNVPVENWTAANKAGRELIKIVQPNSVSEKKRKAIIYYVRRLIKNYLGAEVTPYGSVPLKTYLPYGDIDLTVFGGKNSVDTLATDMKSILEKEEKNPASEFAVKDVQLICAEVKIVKCIVQDIVVDISFNQIGGLCTLCFLEKVDRVIGKDHLFKQSIILIKAWCYYESRILGAHHRLISSYALEILVLYIFHMYNSTLDGPISVLCKFLDYFSKFNWEAYGVSLGGPIRLDSIPDAIVDMPEDIDSDLLLKNDFLSYCADTFSVPLRDSESAVGFQSKFLNIIDPLKEINNLGRSISKGNFFRIRSAFSYGAKTLLEVLVKPQHAIDDELQKYFTHTMTHHGGERRSISPLHKVNALPVFLPHLIFTKPKQRDSSTTNDCFDSDHVDSDKQNTENLMDLVGDYDKYFQYLQYGRSWYEYGLGMRPFPLPPPVMNPSYQPMPDTVIVQMPFKPSRLSHEYQNGFHPIPTLYTARPVSRVLLPAIPYWERVPKARGAGTYFPAINAPPQGLPTPSAKGMNQVQIRSSLQHNHQVPVDVLFNGNHNANSQSVPQEAVNESKGRRCATSSPRYFSGSGAKTSRIASSKEQDRIVLKSSYQLNDKDDFPPLG